MKRMLFVLMLCIDMYILMNTSQVALAETSYDLRSSIQDYCKKVSELNASLEETSTVRGRGRMQMVLFLTNAVDLKFDEAPFEVQCVAYGPGGFSVVLCDDSVRAVEWLLTQESVICAEVDSDVEACSDEKSGNASFQSWGAEALGFAEYLAFAKQVGVNSVTVAVIDSGVYSHSLINSKILSCGYDYVDNDSDPTNDLNGHGTRVAGIVADCTRMLPVYIYPVRVLDAGANGKISNVISAVLEATAAKVDVINLSLSSFSESPILERAIRDAVAVGTTVVVAAGNYSCDASQVIPAKMMDKGVIVVGSVEHDGTRSSFSNYGESVDVYVYGRNILSCSRSGGYVADSGTSMSAPHVSALGAMIKLVHPSSSPANIEERIRAASAGVVPIPFARAMVPQRLGFMLENISLQKDQQLILPVRAIPVTAMEAIKYTSSDPEIVDIKDGILSVEGVGTAQIVASCIGFEDMIFVVSVTETSCGTITLPQNLRIIEEEAFYGMTAARVEIPSGVLQIGDRAFDDGRICLISIPKTVTDIGENRFSGAVILCAENSAALEYAMEHGLQYLIQGNE